MPTWLPPKQLPPMVHPTVTNVEDIYQPYIVPHIHPSHTEVRMHEIFEHRHFCTHTVSQCCDVCNYHVDYCQCPPQPNS